MLQNSDLVKQILCILFFTVCQVDKELFKIKNDVFIVFIKTLD